MQKVLRALIALALLFEAVAFFVGAMLHLGMPLPLPFVEIESLRFTLLEAMSGGVLLLAFLAALMQRRRAWKFAVVANAFGIACLAYIATVAGASAQLSHHRTMIIILIAVLVLLSIPRFRTALENGRHARRRKKVLQTL